MHVIGNLMKTNVRHNSMQLRTLKNNSVNHVTHKNIDLLSPCDAKYLLNRNNISFCAKYGIKKLKKDEFEKISQDVLKKAADLGIQFDNNNKKLLTNYEFPGSDTAVQMFNILFNHKIIELESVKDKVNNLAGCCIGILGSIKKVNSMLEFADFITSDAVESVYKNESVQDEMGSILWDILSFDSDSVDYKKKFVNDLNNHKEILCKDVKIGKYIEAVNEGNYDIVWNNILKKEPPINPTEGSQKTPIGIQIPNIPKIYDDKTKKSFGKVVTKSGVGRSGLARVGGQGKAIEQLEDLVIFPIKYPKFYKGIKTEKGAILYGPPGTGKSLMATALAEELGCYFVEIGASDMEDKFVGGTKDNWKKLFDDLKEHQPSLLFIDEFDALGKKRGGIDVHGDKELNCFLKLVSDIRAENLDIFILGATNNFQALDKAILRDGRFGAHIEMKPPQTVKDIEEIFNIHTDELPLDEKDMAKNKASLFKMMLDSGLSGSAISGVALEAHRNALQRLGIREKMKAGTVTKSDEDNFKIIASDFIATLNKRDESSTAKRQKIGFN